MEYNVAVATRGYALFCPAGQKRAYPLVATKLGLKELTSYCWYQLDRGGRPLRWPRS